MKGLANRRHHETRKKARVKKHLTVAPLAGSPKWVGIYARSPQLCSCMLCGNKRRHFGKSWREVKEDARGEMSE